MKHERLKKAVERYAEVREVLGKNNLYSAQFLDRVITWSVTWDNKEGGEVSLVKVRRKNDVDDFRSDYHGGFYFHTIIGAIKELINYDLIKKLNFKETEDEL